MPIPTTNDEAHRMRAALTANNVAAPEKFRALTDDYSLHEVTRALDDVLAGLRDGNRPQVAINLKFALQAYLDLYPGSALTSSQGSHIRSDPPQQPGPRF